MRRYGVCASLALSVAFVGAAQAQDNMGTDPMTEPTMTEPTMDASAAAGGAYPTEEVLRPINLRAGMVELGAEMGVFTKPDFGDIIGLSLRADYGISDQLQVGVRVPLALVTPEGGETLGGFWLNGLYGFHENFSARLDVGFLNFGGTASLFPFAPAAFGDVDGMKLAFRPGVIFKKAFNDKLALVAEPGVLFHLDSAIGDNGKVETLQALTLPVSLWFQATTEFALALNTGVISGHKFKFSTDDGMWVPLYLTLQHTIVDNQFDVGANVGFGTIATPEGRDIGDTLFLGVFGAYRI